MSEDCTLTGGTISLRIPTYLCAKHGVIDSVISSSLLGLDMHLCQSCFIEKLVEIGVNKVDEVDPD